MFRRLVRALFCATAVMLAGSAFAAPKDKPQLAAARPKCPAGGNYYLKTKPDKEHPVAVKINGKTYYVCNHCRDLVNKKAASATVVKPAAAGGRSGACADCPSRTAGNCPAGGTPKCPASSARRTSPR